MLYRRGTAECTEISESFFPCVLCVPCLMSDWPTQRKMGRKLGAFRRMLAIIYDSAHFLKICFSPDCVFAATERFYAVYNAVGSACSTVIQACYRDVRLRYPWGCTPCYPWGNEFATRGDKSLLPVGVWSCYSGGCKPVTHRGTSLLPVGVIGCFTPGGGEPVAPR